MSTRPQTLSSVHTEAERHRRTLETAISSNTDTFQETLSSAITAYQECLRIAAAVSLFSPNETLDDIASRDLHYLLLRFRIGSLVIRGNKLERREVLARARGELEAFLRLLDGYGVLGKEEVGMFERYLEDREGFEISQVGMEASKRRERKIARFREEKALKVKLEYLEMKRVGRAANANASGHEGAEAGGLEGDDDVERELRMTEIRMAVYETFALLEGLGLEGKMLKMAPESGSLPTTNGHANGNGTMGGLGDDRSRRRHGDEYSDRLDPALSTLSTAHTGPLLSSSGRPMRPFTLLDSRERVQNGVFRPDHSLPTLSIDEYLEEERKRGGIIEGGGEASGRREEVDEDDMELSEKTTYEKRRWDEFAEENPRGSGNTMNMG